MPLNPGARILPIRLGVRWSLSSGAAARRRAGGLLLGAAVVAFTACLAFAIVAGSADRASRARATWPDPGGGSPTAFRMLESNTRYGDRTLTVRFLAPEGTNPSVPPGLDRFPRPGEVFASSALVAALDAHPSLAVRLTAAPVGVVGTSGLEAPDDLLAYVGRPRGGVPEGFAAHGWGAPFSASERPRVPVDGLAVIVTGLVGVPLVAFGAVVGRMSGSSRRRRIVALHLLGVPGRTLAVASWVEAAVLGAAGASVGAVAAAVAIPLVARTPAIGMQWFSEVTASALGVGAVVVAAVAVAFGALAAAATRRVTADPVGHRTALVAVPGRLRFFPAAAGVGVLTAYALLGAMRKDTVVLSSGPFAVLGVVAMLSAVSGAVLALPPVLVVVARLLRRVVSRPALVIAVRRIEMDAAATARASVGVVLLFSTGFLGLAVLADVEAQNAARAQGHLVAVRPSHAYGAAPDQAVASVVADGVILDRGDGASPRWVATCPSLATFAGTAGRAAREAVEAGCVAGQPFWVSSIPGTTPPAGVRGVVLPDLLGKADMLGIEPLTYDTRSPVATPVTRKEIVYALPGADRAAVDRYTDRVLAADPQALVVWADESSLAGLTPILARLVTACVGIGLLVALAALLLASHDQQQERRRDTTALVVMGVPRRVRAVASGSVHLVGGFIACVIGAFVGGLSATAYLSMAGDALGSAHLGRHVTTLVLTALLLVGGAAAAEVAFSDRDVDPELVRRA